MKKQQARPLVYQRDLRKIFAASYKGFSSIVVLLHIIEFSCACNAVLNFEHRFKFERAMSSKGKKSPNLVLKCPHAESLGEISHKIYRLCSINHMMVNQMHQNILEILSFYLSILSSEIVKYFRDMFRTLQHYNKQK